ncbi:hypothetical protein [Streptomyces sp. CBMA123]|uniref:hypothetical protein n=1 Tax=Streptomyces sp. CBMA123 TaxID=1896313 RepID=UPI001661F6CD|nr:hypothetical protein [Streptomyces sp. CBMA123]MBD0691054.1 hypothetical protein [Streptomyces sp. CBMA123]
MAGGVDLVVIGADGGPDRAYGGSAHAPAGARLLAEVLPGMCFDTGAAGCRVSAVAPDADANAMLTAVRDAAQHPGRWLVVCLVGQLVADPRGRRLALVTPGSTPDNAYRRGLAWDWVVSAMVHGDQEEALLLVDAVADRDTWTALERAGEDTAGELLSYSRVPLWGRIGRYAAGSRYAPGRRGRDTVLPGEEGSFSRALTTVLRQGVPGAPAAVAPVDLQPAVAGLLDGGDPSGSSGAPGVRLLVPPQGGRLLMRNRAAVRGALAGLSLSEELLAVLWRESAPTEPPSA